MRTITSAYFKKPDKKHCNVKLCKMCFKQKPLDQFYADYSQSDHRMVWCKECTKKYRRDRYRKQKAENAAIK